ncbi:MAG: hypothetical protein R3A12_17865 [Ignavibacteria bacterium]
MIISTFSGCQPENIALLDCVYFSSSSARETGTCGIPSTIKLSPGMMNSLFWVKPAFKKTK